MWDLRYWLRNHPNLQPIHEGRVFFRLPDHPKTPCIRIYRSGGGVQNESEAPVQDIRVSIELWGSDFKEYDRLDGLRSLVEDLFDNAEVGQLINPTGNTILWNANMTTAFDAPDPETGWPRIVCDVILTVVAASPTVVT